MNLSNKESFETTVQRALADLMVTANAEPTRLLVALSGGPDSTALLIACSTFRSVANVELAAAHVNHNLRGAESAADERFCAELCAKFDVTYHSHTLDSTAADESSLRDARYAVLAAIASEHGYNFIATGHNLDDQTETFLFRVFRGTSPSGLTGIPARRAVTQSTELIRPLLTVRRREILAFLADLKQDYRVDSSNLSSDYNRNFIRNQVLPLVEQRFGDIVPRVEQLRRMIHEEEDVFTELTETRTAAMFGGTHCCPLSAFLSMARALQRRVLADEMRMRGIEVSSERIDSILELTQNGGAISLNDAWRVVVKDGQLSFDPTADDSDDASLLDSSFEAPLHNGLNIFPELGCAIHLTPITHHANGFPSATSDEALVDLSSLPSPLTVRKRRPGDTIKPFGMTESVRLKRYLQTHRRADGTHAGHPVVIATDHEIIWVPGVGLSNVVKVADQPTHRLHFMLLASDELTIA